MGNDFDYLAKLQDYYADHKTLPSYSTIAQMVGFKSKNAVTALVARLKLQGYLESAPDKRLKPGLRFFERLLAESTVRAGFPSAASSDRGDTLSIDEFLVERPSQTVLITVKGDSMIDAGIMPDDIVIVEKRQLANVGDIVVAIVDNEFTLKTLGREKNEFVLLPANKAYPVIRPQGQLEIFGVVVGQFRKYK
ncbi:repressor LexA [Novimethylophilus kurashikiensis]|uniref:Repressor LexA n=1 Tax=Novimethylophilus kurashikiensis TaxID=1825523 RepID=A0A2R5FGG4_9PROT|nr:LexA family transcriptional regulator [Novimethylophilus kurashikiensis]GBG15583.1 repressor LexA [Novimethylophilus kurashikiensis]